MKTFYINRSSNTSADTLLALGWAEMLRIICKHLGRPDEEILLRHWGGSQEVMLSRELYEEQLISDTWIPFLEPLISAKQIERQAKKGRILQDGFFYDQEREKLAQLVEQRKKSKDPEMAKLVRSEPRAELGHYQAINMLKVPDTFNEIVLRWQGLSSEQQWLALGLLFRLFSQPENDVEAASKDWERLAKEQGIERKATVTAVQVINPTTGKGSNTPKSDHLTSTGLDSFWLLELLKFKGFMLGAAPYVLRGSKDRKTYVIQPGMIALGTLTDMLNEFRKICWSSTAIKLDIVASLRLTEVLVGHLRTKLTSRQGLEDWEKEPIVSIARGFDVAYYKDMGSAHATMNVSILNVPNWFPDLTTLAHVDAADELLQEHLRIIRRIEGYQGKEGNDELALLRAYRDFLSGHDLLPFWTFASLYGSYLFRQREHEKAAKRWLPQLTKKGLDILVGILVTEDKRSVPRKSVCEFGWVAAIPELTRTESYFHVKYVPERGKKQLQVDADEQKGGANRGQNIFHRPASSGVYALVSHFELNRIGYNDITQKYVLNEEERQRRMTLLLESVMYTFVELNGAMRSTQLPHLVALEGFIATSDNAIPAPLISPLIGGSENEKRFEYREQVERIAAALNGKKGPGHVKLKMFDTLPDFAEKMREVIDSSTPQALTW